MFLRWQLAFVAVGLAACGSPPVEGRLVDAMTGEPIGSAEGQELRLVAKAVGDGVRLTCRQLGADVAEDGTFRFENLCSNEYPYEITARSGNVWFADGAEIPLGGVEGVYDLEAYRAPGTSRGTYVLGDRLRNMRTVADVDVRGEVDELQVRRAANINEDRLLTLEPGQKLLLAGDRHIGRELLPVIEIDERTLGRGADALELPAGHYVGVRFEDNQVHAAAADIDESQVIDVEGDGHRVRYIPAEAFSDGLYAIADRRRLLLFRVGAAPEAEVTSEE